MSASTPLDLRIAQAVDAAERRLAMLERLTEMAMAVAETVTEAAVEFPHRPGANMEKSRAIFVVTRAVRLTVLLATRVEKSIIAMRKGELGLEATLAAREAADPPATRAERVRAAVTPALEREASDREDAEILRRRLNARLCEGDDAGALLSRPFHDCVKVICTDLGLDPEPILAMEGSALTRSTPRAPQPPPPAHPGECRGPDQRAELVEALDTT